jgi:hypothetical protein
LGRGCTKAPRFVCKAGGQDVIVDDGHEEVAKLFQVVDFGVSCGSVAGETIKASTQLSGLSLQCTLIVPLADNLDLQSRELRIEPHHSAVQSLIVCGEVGGCKGPFIRGCRCATVSPKR